MSNILHFYFGVLKHYNDNNFFKWLENNEYISNARWSIGHKTLVTYFGI